MGIETANKISLWMQRRNTTGNISIEN
jgi:hypothetical protein